MAQGVLDKMRDEARDGQCGLVGWTVRRFGTEDIRERPAGIADEVARLRRIAGAAQGRLARFGKVGGATGSGRAVR